MTLEIFILKAKIVHGDKYIYSKFIYINSKTKGTIICKKHGEFQQNANNHLQGKNCKKRHFLETGLKSEYFHLSSAIRIGLFTEILQQQNNGPKSNTARFPRFSIVQRAQPVLCSQIWRRSRRFANIFTCV